MYVNACTFFFFLKYQIMKYNENCGGHKFVQNDLHKRPYHHTYPRKNHALLHIELTFSACWLLPNTFFSVHIKCSNISAHTMFAGQNLFDVNLTGFSCRQNL